MTPEDLPAAMAILKSWNMAPRPPSASEPDVERSGLDPERAFVAETDEGCIVGVASYLLHDHELAETASLAVDQRARGLGIGTRLQQARLDEFRALEIRRVRPETDRPDTIDWYVRKFGYRIVGRNPKKHAFSLPEVAEWTVLELDLDRDRE